jgi:hypothetical protein
MGPDIVVSRDSVVHGSTDPGCGVLQGPCAMSGLRVTDL